MAEKREPSLVLLLRFPGKATGRQPPGKSYKIELFPAWLWAEKLGGPLGATKVKCVGPVRGYLSCRYRIRVNGKWFKNQNGDRYSFYTSYEFRDLFWRTIKEKF